MTHEIETKTTYLRAWASEDAVRAATALKVRAVEDIKTAWETMEEALDDEADAIKQAIEIAVWAAARAAAALAACGREKEANYVVRAAKAAQTAAVAWAV